MISHVLPWQNALVLRQPDHGLEHHAVVDGGHVRSQVLQRRIDLRVTAKKILAPSGFDRIGRGKRAKSPLKTISVARKPQIAQRGYDLRRDRTRRIPDKMLNATIVILIPEYREHGQDTVGLRQCVQRPRDILWRLREV